MIKSAEGRAGLLHKITKPTAWRGGAQILRERRRGRQAVGQSIGNVTKVCSIWRNKPWQNEELKQIGGSLAKANRVRLEKGFEIVQGKRGGVGCGGFHPKVPLDLTKVTRVEVVSSWKKWGKVESGRNKLVRRCSF